MRRLQAVHDLRLASEIKYSTIFSRSTTAFSAFGSFIGGSCQCPLSPLRDRAQHELNHPVSSLGAVPDVREFTRFISLILRCSVRRLMPSFLAAAVTLPFVAASACA